MSLIVDKYASNTGPIDMHGGQGGGTGKTIPAIRIAHITKHYRIFSTPWDHLRDAIGLSSTRKEFDALHDVSFDIMPGEFWGIVGSNGAGKSTLLKIIAGQLQPTSGDIEIQGRVTLLQLGLGFDRELTGLQNIKHSRMLQGLGEDSEDVEEFVKKFSELGDFINYPVKTYSSGMHSRLAFATAIAGDPDILVADEVLAVGDTSFAQKCLAKMREFKERGKTVVLVTHDITAVKLFCDHAIWLNEGRKLALGPAPLVAEDFRNFMLYGMISQLSLQKDKEKKETLVAAGEAAKGEEPAGSIRTNSGWVTPNSLRNTISTGAFEFEGYRFVDDRTREALVKWRPGEALEFQILFRARRQCLLHSFGLTLHDRNGLIALHLNSEFFGVKPFTPDMDVLYQASFCFDVPCLATGDYSISYGCSEVKDMVVVLVEKFDYDAAIRIEWDKSPAIDNQGGYIIVPVGSFQYQVQTGK